MPAIIDARPAALDLHVIAGRQLVVPITVSGATLTSPVLTMRTGAGDAYTADPGIGSAAMTAATVCTITWTAADTAALNTSAHPRSFRYDLAGVLDGQPVASLIARTLTVWPVGTARRLPQTAATLTVGTSTVQLAVTADPSFPVDGGAPDEVFGGTDGIDGGSFDSAFTDTTHDGGTI